MTFLFLPEFIDEQVDSSTDPLAIMLMREGSFDEAYQMARAQRAGQQQIVEHALIEQRPDRTSGSVVEQLHKEYQHHRRLSRPAVVITQIEQELDLQKFEAHLVLIRRNRQSRS